jgi:hypothetical protein
VWVRPADSDVAADRLECGEMGTGAVQAMVNFGTDTQDRKTRLARGVRVS